MEEIRAKYIKENHRWDDTVIIRCRGEDERLITVKTVAEEHELVGGLSYAFCGRWVDHYRWGRQFVARSFIRVRPHDEAGVIAYLTQAPHVGRKIAQSLWKKFNSDAVKVLREEPERAAAEIETRGFTKQRAIVASVFLESEMNLEDATIDLMNCLAGKGFPRDTLKKCLRKWGNRAAATVKGNPYLLMQFRGCGFAKVDALYLEGGGNPARLKRQTLCIWYAMSRDTTGSSWFDTKFVTAALFDKVGSTARNPVRAVKLGKRAGLLAVYQDAHGQTWITEAPRARAEADIEAVVHSLLLSTPRWPEIDGLDVSDHQAEEMRKALTAPLAVFSGSAGTGKTYAAARLISRIIEKHGLESVAVVAPTGKAAVRITEALEEYGIGIRARTIHSYLGVADLDEEHGAGWTFIHDEDEPVEEQFVIVDESSMIDTSLMASLLRALRPDGHILFVGDIEQLPPVGHGAPLRDLISAGVPTGGLTEIRRNAGAIVKTCSKIRDCEPFPSLPRRLALPDENLIVKPAPDSNRASDEIIKLIRVIRDAGLQDPVWETQVIVAVNEKSALSRKELNTLLQSELNGRNRGHSRFWPNDKIVCLKNQSLPAVRDAMEGIDDEDGWEGYVREDGSHVKLYVANGELGRVVEDYPNKMICEFSSPRRVILVPKGEKGAVSFDLGYAISCHKSQGSEWPVVVVAIDDYYGARMVCDRSWVYTAISRARRACILVGKESTVREMCLRQKIYSRKTFLAERLTCYRLAVCGSGIGGNVTQGTKEDEETIRKPDSSTVHGTR